MNRLVTKRVLPEAQGKTLPRPLDWLGRGGVVTPLDVAPQSANDAVVVPATERVENASPPASLEPDGTATDIPKKKKRERGFKPRKSILSLRWFRRVSQAFFLFAFFWLLTNTAFRGTFAARAGEPVHLGWPVELFLSFDPFIGVMTALSTHTVYRGMLLSLVVLSLTLIVGRAFCGFVCPLGTLNHFFAWVFPSRNLRGKKRMDANRTKRWQAAKYYLLFAFLSAALFGSTIGGLLDPICVAVRALGLGVLPMLQYVGIRSTDFAEQTNIQGLQGPADALADYLAKSLFTANQSYYHESWLISVTFIAILFMNRIIPRFWCRALCPLGALLGTLSRFSILGMQKNDEKCTNCGKCVLHCQGADGPEGGVKHRKEECHLCFNCEAECPEGVIEWKFLPNKRSETTVPSIERRTALASVAAGAVALPALRIADWPDKNYNPKVIRPPGSLEERAFLERCVRCGECMKVCPNNALHPALFEAGIEGLWTPLLIPRIGYCEQSCVLCGQVCPTGAIQKIDEKARLGIGRSPIRMGTAMYDHGRCLPWAMATPCIVCEEFCPVSPKAIWVEEVTVAKRDNRAPVGGGHPPMLEVKVQRPHVDPSLCIGCGACEKACPVVDKPAVSVSSAGETRSRTNVILLENTAYSQKS